MKHGFVRVLVALAVSAGASIPLHADRLVTHDGRVLEVKQAREGPDGNYILTFESGEIVCPARFIASIEIEGDMSDYVPKTDDEKKKLADGYVRYKGKWLGKAAYQAELEKQNVARRLRTDELAEHSEFHDGWEKETKHFRIKTNTSPEILDYYAELLETYYDLMDKRVGIDPSPKLRRTKMQVNVYKSRDEFTEITRVPPGVAGFFSFQTEELNFYHDYMEPETSNWIALHEGTHLLTFLIEPQAWPQIWVNEGIADFFGSATISRDKKGKLVIEPGKLQLHRTLTVQQAIKEKKYVPLEELFQVEKSDFTAFEYAHAWSFIYFLNNKSSEYEKKFKKFFKDFYTIPQSVLYEYEPFPNQQGTAKIVPPEEVRRLLLEKLGVKDVAALEKEWLDFIAGIEISAPEARFKRGYNALREGNVEEFDEALTDLDAAITAGIEDPRAYWARGTLRRFKGSKLDDIQADFEKTVELAPLVAGYRSELGLLLAGMDSPIFALRFLMPATGGKPATIKAPEWKPKPENLEWARQELGLACEIDPENESYRETFDEFVQKCAELKGGPQTK